MERNTVLSIGTFDGVHIGHRAIIARAREIAGPGRVVALAFDPHPATQLRPGDAPPRLTTFEDKARLLREAGADEVVHLEPTGERLALTADEFIARLVDEHRPTAIVEGGDFHFGRSRSGNVSTLRDLGASLGFRVEVVPPVLVDLEDQLMAKASSSLVRWLLRHGRVRDAARVLGRDYELEGEVVPGDRRGRTIGFPTANLSTPCMPPAHGIYAGRCRLPDSSEHPCAVSVGTRPTFDGQDRRVEVFILLPQGRRAGDAGGAIPGLPEYAWRLRVAFDAYLRDEARFGSADALVDQMRRDCARVGQFVRGLNEARRVGKAAACR